MPVVAPYRVSVINRLSKIDNLDLFIYSGQELTGIGVSDYSEEIKTNLQVVRNWFLSPKNARVIYAQGWTRVIRDKCRVVIITEASHNLTNWLLLVARRFFGYRVVVMGHIKPWIGSGKTVLKLRKLLVTHADAVIAYTTEGANQALEWGVPADRVVTMGNTLDLESIDLAKRLLTPAILQSTRNTLGFDDAPVFLFVGRPTPPKRLDLAIEATLALEGSQHPVNLVVIGDSKDIESYKALAARSKRIVFLGEILKEDELARYFALSAAVILPGAVGLTINHAFAYDRPLITSRHAQHRPEIALAKEGCNSIFVSAASAGAFAEHMTRLSSDRALQKKLNDCAKETAVPDQNTMVERIADIIWSVA